MREQVGEFTKAADILEGVAMAEAEKKRRDATACSWEDPLDVAFYRSQKNRAEREALIKKINPKFICPVCVTPEFNIQAWVVSNDRNKTMCRSCWNKLQKQMARGKKIIQQRLFTEVKRYEMDFGLLVEIRKSIPCSGREFARLAGWSHTYQKQIEEGGIKTVSEETMSTIYSVFERLEVTFDLSLTNSVESI